MRLTWWASLVVRMPFQEGYNIVTVTSSELDRDQIQGLQSPL
jgi:hypothetical protein